MTVTRETSAQPGRRSVGSHCARASCTSKSEYALDYDSTGGRVLEADNRQAPG